MLRAIILIALVGHAAAIKCIVGDESAAECAVTTPVTTQCWTHTAKSDGAITRGCGGEGTAAGLCNEAAGGAGTPEGKCAYCITDRDEGCNAVGSGDFMCVVTGSDGVDAAPTACDLPKCWTKTDGDAAAKVTRGCGVCDKATPVAGTCDTCITPRDKGCNVKDGAADLMCWVGKITATAVDGVAGNTIPTACSKDKCYSRTLDATPTTMDKGCGACDATKATTDGYTCGDDCDKAGCNEPPVFQCFQKADWKEDDGSVATTCGDTDATKYFNLKEYCSKTVDKNGTIAKGCGKCPATADLEEGSTCYECKETGCNSASGLFSVLALSMAVIYQLA